MLDALRKLMLSINARAQAKASLDAARRLAVLAIKSGPRLAKQLEAIQEMADRHEAETAGWVAPEVLAQGRGGRFDACDLRHWLALAGRAGVPAVPAREILSLSEAEIAVASGRIELPAVLARRLQKVAREQFPDAEASAPEETPDPEAVREKLAAAMDEVPYGYMVRHVRCGPSSLKALAGCGASGPEAPEVRFGADLEVGPGWVRLGNRRLVDAADKRFVEGYSQGPNGPSVFVARPWVQASRFFVGEDPHRHGTQFAGKGVWPAEWRAFVENGEVIGVSSYYAWCGQATPENARMALKVRAAAQRIIDETRRQNAVPVYMDVEFVRDSAHFTDVAARFPRDAIACTLDFIETKDGGSEDGLLFLEGGPAYTRAGGGHPCGFAGLERPEGVAFTMMPGVCLGDPKTWKEGDRTGRILSWAEVEDLAAREQAA
jgi:hypothetical protein